MKKNVLLFLIGILANSAFAQDYYTGKTTVMSDDITFDVKFGAYIFSLRNVNNEKNRSPRLYYKDGRELEWESYEMEKAATFPGCVEQAFVETFTKEEYLKLRKTNGNGLSISYVISPNGDTVEVTLIIDTTPDLLAIPPSKFALLEKNLKKYVKWDVTSLGKQLKYLYGMSFANFPKMTLLYPGDSLPEVGGGHLDIKDPNLPGFYKE